MALMGINGAGAVRPIRQNKAPHGGSGALGFRLGGTMDEGSSDGWREHPPPRCWVPTKGFNSIPLTFVGQPKLRPVWTVSSTYRLARKLRETGGSLAFIGRASSLPAAAEQLAAIRP